MRRLQGYRFELLNPDGAAQRAMRQFAGSTRFVYNRALALQTARRERGEKKLGYAAICKALTGWKREPGLEWLDQMPSQTLQQSLKDLEQAYANFFAKRAAFPTFKKKGEADGFRYPQGCSLDQANSRIFLPKLGWLRYRNSQEVLGIVKNVTVSQTCGKWFVSIQTEREVEQPVSKGGTVGLDLGVARFATLSDGSHIEPLNSFKKHQERLARHQRRMAHRTKFSNNWKKEKTKVQKLQGHIANARRDFLHKTSTTISKNHAIVCIEDLRVKNMSQSAAGTIEQPGRNVRAKAGLSRSILDQGWGEFRRQLDYKTAWNGGHLIAVPPQYTSLECPECHHIAAENRRSQAHFACANCGYENHADHVGAINILSRGVAVLRDEGQDTADDSAGRETAARLACEVNGAARPSATGTHRSDHAGTFSRMAQ